MSDAFRLAAVELLVIDTLTSRYLSSPDPVAIATGHREHMRDVLSQTALPFLGGAGASELVVGGVGDAIDFLIELACETTHRKVGERRQP